MDAQIHSTVLAPFRGSIPLYKDEIDASLIRIAGTLSSTSYERTGEECNHNHATWVAFAAFGFFFFMGDGDNARRSHNFDFTGDEEAFLCFFSVKEG